MNYPGMRSGDRLPVTAVLQQLLNLYGAGLLVDGHYGPLTRQAVVGYQRHNGLHPDGTVGPQTWAHITTGFRLPIIDCIDVWDESLYNSEVQDISAAGGSPVMIGGMSNGVAQAVQEILHTAAGRPVFLLRFHGHGSPGVAGISDGRGEAGSGHQSYLDSTTAGILEPLRGIFGPYGCVQFMHCATGSGPDGRRMLENISDMLNVPVTAAINRQYGGGQDTFRFEGPVYNAFPHGSSLSSWSLALPAFHAISV